MDRCRKCGGELKEESFLYCPYCGSKREPAVHPASAPGVSKEEFKSFIGKRADYYWNKFQLFRHDEEERFAFSWNWAAFFLGFIWMLYRKMYLWALIAFLVALTPVTLPLLMVVWGLTGNYLYFWHARQKIQKLRSIGPSGDTLSQLGRVGGVNPWVWFFGLFLLLLLLVIGLLGGLFLVYWIEELLFRAPPFIKT